ncbi:MAG: hypothetical protein ACQKBT_12760, partial [Puniceicoccales bacterium]
MSARSDSFVIRTYGDARNPVTGEVIAKAWCEAVVQRLPDYLGGDAPETQPAELSGSPLSETFGRRYVATRIQWLTEQEI